MNATLYTTSGCPYCIQAKALLSRRGVNVTEIDVGASPDQRAALIARTGRRTVPQIYIEGNHVGGFDDLVAFDRIGGLRTADTQSDSVSGV
ncbi:glutaredoxin 3 [Ectopseudomonas toyotomiensis]|uniref:Glutaredoxin n=1 Tax=Ectopseudomonas toyotomiensis TaxID=554344 RepID=A0ABD7E2L5_9GAMM|nr:glutaredoxin 3 [Pseudomonas toyotomiensis]QSL94978.1 glutaredoxin 3 [Pseudomonas toyotomiensis]